MQKIVRFFDTTLINEHDVRGDVEPGYWRDVLIQMSEWPSSARSAKVGEVAYIGRSVSPLRPALPHIQLERIRDLGEQLNVSNLSNGDVGPLRLEDPDERVSEPTYIVPFGQLNRVAVMSPAVQATRPETLGRWLTDVMELPQQGRSIGLTPVVDTDVLDKILGADGAVMLEVHVDAGAPIPAAGGSVVGDAIRNAQRQSLRETRLVLRWSLDRSGGPESVRDALKQGALWVARNAFSSRAQVKLVQETGANGLTRELHSIFDDRVTKKVSFHTQAGQRASDNVILEAIGDAIEQFQRPG